MIAINIFDAITGETYRQIAEATKILPDNDVVELNIASYGGEILSTFAIIDLLSRFHTKSNVIGFAASAAAILAISCNECSVSENAIMMLHSAYIIASDDDAYTDGIRQCNDRQLSIINKRNPEFTLEMLKDETWLSAEECLNTHLADNINININVDYSNLCNKLVAKLNTFVKGDTMEHDSTNEVVREVKEEVAEEVVENHPIDHDLVEVVEKLTEELNALKARVLALETPCEEEKKDESSEQDSYKNELQARVNKLYANVVKPVATLPIGSTDAPKKSNKVDYKKYKKFITE